MALTDSDVMDRLRARDGAVGPLPTFTQKVHLDSPFSLHDTYGCMVCSAVVLDPVHHMRWHAARGDFDDG